MHRLSWNVQYCKFTILWRIELLNSHLNPLLMILHQLLLPNLLSLLINRVNLLRRELKRPHIKQKVLVINLVLINLVPVEHLFYIFTGHDLLVYLQLVKDVFKLNLVDASFWAVVVLEEFFVEFLYLLLDY